MDFKKDYKYVQLIYDLITYDEQMSMIIDGDGIMIADLVGASDGDDIIVDTFQEALQQLVERDFSQHPFYINEVKLISEDTYDSIIRRERELIREELVLGTHPLYKELEEGLKLFKDRANIFLDLLHDPVYAKEVFVEVCDGGEFENKLLPIEDVVNEYLYDWCLDHDLYEQTDFETDNRFFNKIASYFINYTTMYEERIESFVYDELRMDFKTLVEIANDGFRKYYDELVAELFDEDNIADALYDNGVQYYYNGEVFEG